MEDRRGQVGRRKGFGRRQAARAIGLRVAAIDLSEQGKYPDSIAALQAVAKDGTGAYPVLANFGIATAKAESGDRTGAVAEYAQINETMSPAVLTLVSDWIAGLSGSCTTTP